MTSILYIGRNICKTQSGADVINKRNIFMLKTITDGNLDFIEPEPHSAKDKIYLGISNMFLSRLSKQLKEKIYTHVFISQSLYGRAASYIRINYPEVKVITFCHNIEIDYARSYFKTSGIKALPFYLCVKYWEKKCIMNSSHILTLNQRDSKRLKAVYNKKSSAELPTSFIDEYDEKKATTLISDGHNAIDFLFVGVAFFPNIQGVQWFIDNVMPKVNGNLYVIGKGMDKIKFKNLNARVYIHGYVDDLSEYYYRAKVVISPIFSGAGMKTKTAEALMYGKTIIGTPEAFEGYEIDERCMKLAYNSQDFIKAINNISSSDSHLHNHHSRHLFCRNHNTLELIDRLSSVFKI